MLKRKWGNMKKIYCSVDFGSGRSKVGRQEVAREISYSKQQLESH